MNSVNIEDIMKQIRGEAVVSKENPCDNKATERATAGNFDKRYFDDSVAKLKRTHYVAWHREITGNPLARAVKKIVRKLTYFFIAPVVEDQNKYNIHNADALAQISDYITKTQETINELQTQVEDLKAEVNDLKKTRK